MRSCLKSMIICFTFLGSTYGSDFLSQKKEQSIKIVNRFSPYIGNERLTLTLMFGANQTCYRGGGGGGGLENKCFHAEE